MLGVFLVVFSYRSAFSLLNSLRNPFSWTRDRINVDMLMASTDMCLFTVLRGTFAKPKHVSFRGDAKRGIKRESAWRTSALKREASKRISAIDPVLKNSKRELIVELGDCREL